MDGSGRNLIVRFIQYLGNMLGLLFDNSLIRLFKLIDYPRFHSLHFDNLMADYKRLRLGDETIHLEKADARSRGFFEIGREYEIRYISLKAGVQAAWAPNVLDVLVLERVIVHFLPDAEIKLRALYIQQRYKSLISEAAFEKLQSQMNFQIISEKTDCNQLRAELDFLLRDLTRGYINAPLPYSARQNIWIYAFWIGIFEYSLIFLFIKIYNLSGSTNIPVSALLVPLFGSTGAFISIKQRVEALPYGNDAYRNIILLNASMVGLIFGLVRGAAFAIILNILMISGLIDGELFPKYDFSNLPEASGLGHTFGFLFHLDALPTSEISKILIWSLVAGFSERLLPDALERLADPKANSNSQPSLNINQSGLPSSPASGVMTNLPEPLLNPTKSFSKTAESS